MMIMLPTLNTFYFKDDLYENLTLRDPDYQGWQCDVNAYREIIKEIRPSVIIEVGVWKGCSTIAFAEAMKEQQLVGKVIAVDTWLGAIEFWTKHIRGINDDERDLLLVNGFPSLYYTFISNVVHRNVQDYVIPLPMPSTMAAQLVKYHKVTADIIHIDASHEFEDVRQDLNAWWSLLRDGGVFIIDDYDNSYFPGVRQAVDEFVPSVGRIVEHLSDLKKIIRK